MSSIMLQLFQTINNSRLVAFSPGNNPDFTIHDPSRAVLIVGDDVVGTYLRTMNVLTELPG